MKAIMLLHGFLTNIHDFDPIVPYLKEEYDYVDLFVVPGHTEEPNYKEFDADLTFKKLLETYDEISKKYERIDCIGFSMGGALATYLQSVRKIDNLVLLAPANKYLNFSLIHNRIRYRQAKLSEMRKVKNQDEMLYNLIKEKLKEMKIDDKTALNLGFNDLFPNYNYHNLTTFMNIINRCNKELISIDTRTLIIWGKLDQLVPFASIEFVSNLAINEKEIIIYDDISHLMLRSENKDKIINSILEFLRSYHG